MPGANLYHSIGHLVGPGFLNALAKKLGKENVAAVGVMPYAASLLGYVRGKDPDPVGTSSLGKLVSQARKKCPDSALVFSGWR